MKPVLIVGPRPNLMKASPVMDAFSKHKIKPILINTGQHYDEELSKILFDDLKLTKPDVNLNVGVSSLAKGSRIKKGISFLLKIPRLSKEIKKQNPDIVLVFGDTTSTLMGAVAARLAGCKLGHVEAGLRSFNLKMPEEYNRRLVDRLSHYLFVTEKSAIKNLKKEGMAGKKIHFVGNVMIDTLKKHKSRAKKSKILKKLNLKSKKYAVLTLHRSEHIGNKKILNELLNAIGNIQKNIKIVWPIHPRTRRKLEKFGFNSKLKNMKNLMITNSLGYLDFLNLTDNSRFVLTDSGGLQEETTILKIPCLTLRRETERPVTVEKGTNIITGIKENRITEEANKILNGKVKKGSIPEFWDGKAAERIVEILKFADPIKTKGI